MLLQQLGHPEVQELHVSGLVHQNIRGFDVAVNHMVRVCILQRIQHLQNEPQALIHP